MLTADRSAAVVVSPARMSSIEKALIAVAVAVLCTRALATGAVFNHTFDEPTQIASGLELWQYGTFTVHVDVPPLAKLLMASVPYAAGVRETAIPARGDVDAMNRFLYGSGRYWFVLRSARAVSTVIGGLLVVLLAWYGWRTFGPWAGAATAWATAVSPGLVSAASIANSDILGVLTVLATFYTFRRLLQTGTLRWAVWWSLAGGLALATKLSAVPFFMFGLPVIAVVTLGKRLFEPLWRPVAVARLVLPVALAFVLIVPLVIWSAYGFRLAPPIGPNEAEKVSRALGSSYPQLTTVVSRLPVTSVPLGAFVRGVGVGYNISKFGHPAYLMGEFRLHGWPYYFLVTLMLKVPLGIWLAVIAAGVVAVHASRTNEGQEVLLLFALCAAMLASVAGAGINAGHRHIVIVEALFAGIVGGGVGLALRARGRLRVIATAVIVMALAVGGVASLRSPYDALGYTNALAGSDPDWWFIDSNVDWGQDLERLHQELVARHVDDTIHLAYFGTAEPSWHGIRSVPLPPGQPTCGWIAISANTLRGLSNAGIGVLPPERNRRGYEWLLHETPVARIGTSMRLYHLTDAETKCAASAAID